VVGRSLVRRNSLEEFGGPNEQTLRHGAIQDYSWAPRVHGRNQARADVSREQVDFHQPGNICRCSGVSAVPIGRIPDSTVCKQPIARN